MFVQGGSQSLHKGDAELGERRRSSRERFPGHQGWADTKRSFAVEIEDLYLVGRRLHLEKSVDRLNRFPKKRGPFVCPVRTPDLRSVKGQRKVIPGFNHCWT